VAPVAVNPEAALPYATAPVRTPSKPQGGSTGDILKATRDAKRRASMLAPPQELQDAVDERADQLNEAQAAEAAASLDTPAVPAVRGPDPATWTRAQRAEWIDEVTAIASKVDPLQDLNAEEFRQLVNLSSNHTAIQLYMSRLLGHMQNETRLRQMEAMRIRAIRATFDSVLRCACDRHIGMLGDVLSSPERSDDFRAYALRHLNNDPVGLHAFYGDHGPEGVQALADRLATGFQRDRLARGFIPLDPGKPSLFNGPQPVPSGLTMQPAQPMPPVLSEGQYAGRVTQPEPEPVQQPAPQSLSDTINRMRRLRRQATNGVASNA